MAKGPHQFLTIFLMYQKMDLKYLKMVLGMLFENLKKYYKLRYDIYDFLKIVSEGP